MFWLYNFLPYPNIILAVFVLFVPLISVKIEDVVFDFFLSVVAGTCFCFYVLFFGPLSSLSRLLSILIFYIWFVSAVFCRVP